MTKDEKKIAVCGGMSGLLGLLTLGTSSFLGLHISNICDFFCILFAIVGLYTAVLVKKYYKEKGY